MPTVIEPFFRILDDEPGGVTRVEATGSTAGPWFADAQHMGPPSALLVRALERHGRSPEEPPVRLARLTVEVLGKVPLGEMEVETVVERAGRTIELLGAELRAGGRAVARAHGWRHVVTDVAAAATDRGPAMGAPDEGHERDRPEGWLPGYLDALEWRWVSGALEMSGPGRVWARLRVPVVVGADGVAEEPSGWQRVAAVADSTNGAGARLDASRWLFLNTDLTLHLHRDPVGEWVGLDADSVIGPDGAGTAFSVLHDLSGPVGRAAQALTVRPR